MPVIPEKRQLDSRVQEGGLAAQFWGQPVESARVISGATAEVPCEPPPLPLAAPSGLSRTQLLVAAHAAGLPLFPGWCEEHGGLVLDRVLLQSGRPRWWAALTGRLKAQRMLGQRNTHALRESLSDPDNYALAASGRLLLSKATLLRASVQADSLNQVPASFRGWRIGKGRRGPGADGVDGGGAPEALRGMSASLQLRQALVEGAADLTADLAVNEPSLDGVRPSVNTPLRLSVDVAPRPSLWRSPLLYRVGAHSVLAPTMADGSGPHVLAAHMQGALALAGHCTLWQAANKPWQRRGKPGAPKSRPLQLRQAADKHQQQHLQAAAGGADAGGASGGAEMKAVVRRQATAASDGDDGDGGGGTTTRRHPPKPRRARPAAGGSSSARDGAPPLVTPGQVQDGLQQTTWRLERLRTDLQSWAGRARAGELLKAGARGKKRGAGGRGGGCWSSVLPAPHLRVGGLLGVLGRVPLHRSTFDAAPAQAARGVGAQHAAEGGASSVGAHGDASAAAAAGGAGAWLRQLGGAGRGFVEHVVVGGLGGLGSHLAHDVGVRLFGSGGASLQLGQMRRALLDFSRLEATLDLGLTGPRVGGGGGAGGGGSGANGGARHPAFALDDTGAWHALTLSATQQLIGPVRLRADWRFALDSGVPLYAPAGSSGGSGGGSIGSGADGGGGGGKSWPLMSATNAAAQVARHVGGMRPSLLDAAFGADVVVPGSGGLARAVVWYSPRRREGAIEVRLL